MPKKTRKQKILAAYHKQIRLVDKAVPPSQHKETITISTPKIEDVEPQPEYNRFFFVDLRKSLLLVSAVIALEIALYFAKLIR